MIDLEITELTINDCLYIILAIMCLWLIVQLFIRFIRLFAIKQWKPKTIYYEIKNTQERCIVSGAVMKEPNEEDRYYLEYKSVDTGLVVKRKIVNLETYTKFTRFNVFTRKQSEIILYTIAPNDQVLKYRKTSSNDGGAYCQYSEEDITKNLIDTAKEYFMKNRPKRYVYKTQLDMRTFRKKQAYLDTLPTVDKLIKRGKMQNAENKVRKSQGTKQGKGGV